MATYPHEQDARALVISTAHSAADAAGQIGRQDYSYHYVYRAFAPLLQRWGSTIEITRPESRLDFALWNARKQNLAPLHLSFLPLHATYFSRHAPTVAFPFWEYPDLPDANISHNTRNNWVRVASHLAMILTASRFTRDAFHCAGVRAPVRVVPVPVRPEYFEVPDWQPGQRVILDHPCYAFPQEAPRPVAADPWAAPPVSRRTALTKVKRVYKGSVRPRLPEFLDCGLTLAARGARAVLRRRRKPPETYPTLPRLDLSGVVYASILNPFDPRKNYRDLLSAFLLALRDCDDATLVLKLAVVPELEQLALENLVGYYRNLGLNHRCQLRIVTAFLSDAEMIELAQASTFYLNASHAEGACLPLQDFLAAGRPGISPRHTAMLDYFDASFGFVIESHPEPTYWPHDPEKRLTTTWHRLAWQSLHDRIRESYAVAQRQSEYQRRAALGRERMTDYASLESVWPRLADALDELTDERRPKPLPTTGAGMVA